MTINVSTMPDSSSAGSGRPALRRWRRVLALATVAGLASIGLVASPSQANTVTCTGNLSNTVVPSSVQVPAGAACTMSSVLVIGNIDVGIGADLFLTGTTVTGRVTVLGNAFAYVTNSTVTSGTRLRDAFGLVSEQSTLAGGVDVRGAVLFFSQESNHAGLVVSEAGWTFIESGQIAGGVRTVQDQATDLLDTTIAGQVTINGTSNGSVVCQSTIGGGTSVTNSGGVIQFGGDQPLPECGSNVIIGGLQVNNNAASLIRISSNLVIGGLFCTGNTPAPAGSNNHVIGPASGQCASLVGNPLGVQATTEATPDSRRAEIWALVSQRLA